MAVHIVNTFCFCLPLRTGCLIIGWFDIVYGHVMVLLYLVSMYTGYFNVTGPYRLALWLDFIFTIIQLLGGIILVYGVKYKTIWLVFLSSLVGLPLMVEDVVGDVLLLFSFPNTPTDVILIAGLFLITFIGMRGYMTFGIYCYFEQLRQVQYIRNKILYTVPDFIQTNSYRLDM